MVLSKDFKFAICFGLIIGTLISFCSLCFASDEEIIDDVNFSPHLIINSIDDTFYYDAGIEGGCLYISVEAGRTYTINSSNGLVNCGLTTSVPSVDVDVDVIAKRVDTFTFTALDDGYFLVASSSNSNTISGVTFSVSTGGLDNFIADVVKVLSYDDISNILFFVVPILGISVLFALGFYFIKRIMNKSKHAKGGV